MYDEIRVLTHSSIKISGTSTIYVDPFKIKDALTDADIILSTHEHYDHFSPEDIKKVQNGSTVFVAPQSMIGKLEDAGIESEFIEYVEPGDELEISGVTIKAVPAYNVLKNWHDPVTGRCTSIRYRPAQERSPCMKRPVLSGPSGIMRIMTQIFLWF